MRLEFNRLSVMPIQPAQNESSYKLRLIDYILEEQPSIKFASEFPFGFLKRRADFILVEPDCTHAIEIKSDIDNTYTLAAQLGDYQKSFNKVSVLISEKHYGVIKTLDTNIGILILRNGEVYQQRKAKMRKRLDRKQALDLLNTSNLKSLSNSKGTRFDMINELASSLTLKTINHLAYESVKNRVEPVYSLFLKEYTKPASAHDLEVLAMRQVTL